MATARQMSQVEGLVREVADRASELADRAAEFADADSEDREEIVNELQSGAFDLKTMATAIEETTDKL